MFERNYRENLIFRLIDGGNERYFFINNFLYFIYSGGLRTFKSTGLTNWEVFAEVEFLDPTLEENKLYYKAMEDMKREE